MAISSFLVFFISDDKMFCAKKQRKNKANMVSVKNGCKR